MANDFVSVLRHPTHALTKTWKTNGTVAAYGDPKHFTSAEAPVSSIHDLSRLLFELEADPQAAVIRGRYIGRKRAMEVDPDTKPGRVLRRKSVHDDVPHHWMLVDVDNYEPFDCDPLLEPVKAINEFITLRMPACFRGVSYHWQLSSSAGHPSKKPSILRAHIWFWLEKPCSSAPLKAWASAESLPVDTSLFDHVQLHYTARPVFEAGVVDPIATRSGFFEGDFGDAVNLALPDAEQSTSTSLSRAQKLRQVRAADPVIGLLLIKSERPDGGLNIECPRKAHHTSESDESSTLYFPAHTGGYKTGNFQCLHAHCRDASQSAFLEALGYDDLEGVFKAIVDGNSVQLKRADTIKPEPISWLMVGWLALGKLILLAGSPGTGKTTLAMAMAATVTIGGKWPDGTACNAGSVVLWSGEDDAADTLVPRLLASGADLKRVHFVADTLDREGPRSFDPSKDMPLLLAELGKLDDVRLIVVDPIVSAVAGDSHKNAEVRRALQPLVDLASDINATLVGITHFTKGTGGRDTTERVTGSLAFGALARVVLATARDQAAGDFVLTRSKSNIGPDGGGFRYRLEQVELAQHPGVTTSRVAWGDQLEGFARDLIASAEGDSSTGDGTGVGSVDEWLRSLLTAAPRLAADVYALGELQGHGERKLLRSLRRIGGVTEKVGFRGRAWWRLPGGEILNPDEEVDPWGSEGL